MLYDINFHIPPFFFLSFSQAELRTNGVAPFSLLSQPSVVQRLQAEGSAFVTSNFLFSEPHMQQGMRVATTGKGKYYILFICSFSDASACDLTCKLSLTVKLSQHFNLISIILLCFHPQVVMQVRNPPCVSRTSCPTRRLSQGPTLQRLRRAPAWSASVLC